MENSCLTIEQDETVRINNTNEQINQKNTEKNEKGDNIQNFCSQTKKAFLKNKKNNVEIIKSELSNKFTKENLEKLCEQLSAFNKRVQTAKDTIYIRYELPYEMRDKLEEEAAELDCLFAELQSAANNVEIIRNQRTALSKEKLCLTSQLNRLKADAIQEMEVIVSVYDNTMMERWEVVKQKNSIQETENFLHEVKGKLEAMKNLQILSTQKLTDLKKQEEQNQTKKEIKKINNEEKENEQTRSYRSNSSNRANSSQVSQLSFLLDTDSEDNLDDGAMNSVLYNYMCTQALNMNLPSSWSDAELQALFEFPVKTTQN